MRRREFIALIGGATAWPLGARAQWSTVPVLGILSPTTLSGVWLPLEAAFRQGLSDAGYSEARNMRIEGRWGDGQYDRLPALAADLVQHGVSAILRSLLLRQKRQRTQRPQSRLSSPRSAIPCKSDSLPV
jgi:putative ABC transport system substrate-binding protein